MSFAIEAKGLHKIYGRSVALGGVSFRVPEGAVYALVGANGAGKSTLIKVLMNILEPTDGEAWMMGARSDQFNGVRLSALGYVSENQKLPEWMTVGRLLSYLRPFYPKWDRELEDYLVRRFDLPLKRKLKHLSRGMRMKAAFVSSLAYRPEVIVLDEPLSGLDPLVRDELVESLQWLQRQGKPFTAFLSTHDLGEIENFATHVGYIEKGRILFSEETRQLKKRFRKVVVRFDGGSRVPSTASKAWLQLEVIDSAIHFVHSKYEGETSEHEVRAAFPNALETEFEAMPLRAIFVAVAKSGRDTATFEKSGI